MENNTMEEWVVLTDEELKSLTDAIHQRHGIDFSCYETKSLKRRVSRAISVFKFNSAMELWTKVLKDRAFVYPLMDEISVGLTSMFRDPVLWRSLKKILGDIGPHPAKLKIWHAGCSSGEEVYTMGIVLKESALRRPYSMWATDISKQSLEIAKRGEYHLSRKEEFIKNYKEYHPIGNVHNYYKSEGAIFQVDPTLIDRVSFDYHNLITDPFTQKFDIIFCRNVMIYFDNKAKHQLFEKFYYSLSQGGLLIIGFYDAVLQLLDKNKFEVYDLDAKIFRKVDN
jgi:chemotaxis protein methyltransferase CheR